MTNSTISALIIAKNEELMIESCMDSLSWCDEIIVVDNGSIDKTRELAENYGATVISFKHRSFSKLREEALKRVTSDWAVYIDADERVTPTLAKEILVNIETGDAEVFRLTRENIHFGKKFNWGGWQNDKVERVFKKGSLKGWTGDIHESPEYVGKLIDLKTKLPHFTHRNVVSGLLKTASWTPAEAKELFKSNIPPVTFFVLLRKGFMEFFRRAILKKGHRDGMEGLTEAIIQGMNKVLIYIQVWELQQNPSINDKYDKKEVSIKNLWKKEQNLRGQRYPNKGINK